MPKKQKKPQRSIEFVVFSAILAAILLLYAVIIGAPANNKTANNQTSETQTKTQLAPGVEDVSEHYQRLMIRDDDRYLGNKDADIVIVEFLDFECPFCKRIHTFPRKIQEEFKDKVVWVFRHLPLPFHEPYATREALAVECAYEQQQIDGYMKMHDKIFGGEGKYSEEKLVSFAEEIGLDKEKFRTCLTEERYKKRIERDLKQAQTVGAQGTPTIFILDRKNQKAYGIFGALPYEDFRDIVKKVVE